MCMIRRSSVEKAVTWVVEPRILLNTAKPAISTTATTSTAATTADKVSSLGEAKQADGSSTPLSEPSQAHEVPVPALEHLVFTAETLLSDAAQGTARLLGPPPPSDVEGKKGSNRYANTHIHIYILLLLSYGILYVHAWFTNVAYTDIHMYI